MSNYDLNFSANYGPSNTTTINSTFETETLDDVAFELLQFLQHVGFSYVEQIVLKKADGSEISAP